MTSMCCFPPIGFYRMHVIYPELVPHSRLRDKPEVFLSGSRYNPTTSTFQPFNPPNPSNPSNNNNYYCFATTSSHYICGMSSTREMEPDTAKEIATLEGMIRNVSNKSLKSFLEGLLFVIKASPSFDAVQVLRKFISYYPQPKVITKVFRLILPIRASVRD